MDKDFRIDPAKNIESTPSDQWRMHLIDQAFGSNASHTSPLKAAGFELSASAIGSALGKLELSDNGKALDGSHGGGFTAAKNEVMELSKESAVQFEQFLESKYSNPFYTQSLANDSAQLDKLSALYPSLGKKFEQFEDNRIGASNDLDGALITVGITAIAATVSRRPALAALGTTVALSAVENLYRGRSILDPEAYEVNGLINGSAAVVSKLNPYLALGVLGTASAYSFALNSESSNIKQLREYREMNKQ